MKHLALILLLAFVPVTAVAHSQTQETSPANGAVLKAIPDQVSLSFTDKLRLTKVEARHSAGGTQELDLDGYKSFETEFTLPLNPMGAGIYEVEWRGLGVDGHPMQGSFSFQVD